VEFRILGPVEVWTDGRRHELGSRKECCVLAVLLWELGRPIPVDTLLQRVWEADASDKTLSSLYSNVSRLRKKLRWVSGEDRNWLPLRAGSYVLDAGPGGVDYWRFRALHEKAKAAAARGDDELAVALVREAEGLWRGVPLTGLDGAWAEGVRTSLTEERFAATILRVRAALRLGLHAELIGELFELAAERPLIEAPTKYLMIALHRSGRRADASREYRRFRSRLRDGEGSDPTPELRDLHQRILSEDPEPADSARIYPAPRATSPPAPTSAMPRDDPDFTGRAAELRALTAWIDAAAARLTVPVAVITGMPGVGKSTFAVHAAHLLSDRYPEQLHLSLRAHDPAGKRPLEPTVALATGLRRLGVPDAVLPADAEDRAALWRSTLAGRSALIVLDDALDADQVLPLLPGAPGSVVLVTTRRRALSLPGMLPLPLGIMPPADAIALFMRTAGADRAADPAAVAAVARLCGYVPLEIQLAGRHLRHHPAWNVGDLASRLRDMPRQDRGMTAALALSCQHLTAGEQRLFQRLVLHPGGSFRPHAAMALADHESLAETEHGLDALLDFHLIEEPVPGRYAFHDLIRDYARSLAGAGGHEQDRRQAMRRLLDYYVGLADRADRIAHPFHRRIPLPAMMVTPALPPSTSRDDRGEQLEAEKASLLGLARYAAEGGWPEHAGLLAHLFGQFLDTWGDWTDAIDLHRLAVAAWRSIGHAPGEATALVELSVILSRAGGHDEALRCAADALAIARAAADKAGTASALDAMGLMFWRSAQYPESLARHGEALAIWRALGDRHGEADGLFHTAIVYWHLRRSRDALRHAEQALAAYRELGDGQGETNALNFVGGMQQDAKCYELALGSYQQALAKFQAIGDRQGEAIAFSNIGDIHRLSGQPATALKNYRTALDIFRQIGDRRSEAETMNSMGAAFLVAGDHAAALTHHHKALALAGQLAERYLEAASHLGVGAVHLATGRHVSAADDYRNALELSRRIGDPRQEADALYGLGCALLGAEDEAAARDMWLLALGHYESLGCPEATAVRARLDPLGHSGRHGGGTGRSGKMAENHPRPAA